MPYQIKLRSCLALILIGMATILPISLSGQDNSEYSGLIKVGKYVGKASFEYRKVRKDTVLNGDFQMQGSNIDSIWSSDINYFSFQGLYKKNKLNGDWAFRLGQLSSSSDVDLVNYQLYSKLNGTIHDINVQNRNGLLHGVVSHHIYIIRESEVEESLFKGSLSYKQGMPQGGFCIEDSTVILDGIFSEEGLANGTWILREKEPPGGEEQQEEWKFINGLPRRVTKTQGANQTVQEIENFQSRTQVFKPIRVSERFFQILTLQQRLRGARPVQSRLEELILKNEELLQKQNRILTELGGNTSQSHTQFALPYFPFERIEKKHLDTVQINIEQAEEMIGKLQSNKQLQILKDFDNNTLFYLNVTEWISQGLISSLRQALQYEKSGILEFLPRKSILKLPAFDSLKQQMVHRQKLSNDSVYTFRIAQYTAGGEQAEGLEGLKELSKTAVQSLDSIGVIAEKRLAKYRKQQELAGLNQSLTAQMERFQIVYDSTRRELPEGPYKSTISTIHGYTLKLVEDYREVKSTQLKISQANNIINCVENAQELILSVSNMPEYSQDIETEYTEEVWNPFLATTMQEIVKERILNAYREKLIPYILSGVQSQLSCENTSKYLRLIDAIHLRMIEIRQKDTAEIEKKLKYEERPEKIMELLSI